MKVYMLSSNYGGCYYVRQYLPMIYNGWTGDFIKMDVDRDNKTKIKECLESDIIVAHRLDDKKKHEVIDIMKKLGKKIVVDNDDTTIIEEVGSMSAYMEYQGIVHDGFKKADLITCSTEFLKKEYLKYNKNVIVLPNMVDFNNIPEYIPKNNNKVRIGIIGSSTYKDDLEGIYDLLLELNKRDDVQLVIYGLKRKEERTEVLHKGFKKDFDLLDKLDNAEWVSWTPMSKYWETLNNFNLDFVVIHRKDNYFNRCKSNLKFLEMSALKIPCICSSFPDSNSPYDKDISNYDNGVLCSTQQEWIDAIEYLFKRKDIREEIGFNAYNYVKQNYNIKNKAYLWREAYKTIL